MRIIIYVGLLIFGISLSTEAMRLDCSKISAEPYRGSTEYRREECLGKQSLSTKKFKDAETHFRKALMDPKIQQPNYEMLIELGFSLCFQGKKKEGKKAFDDYTCRSGVELGMVKCGSNKRACGGMPCKPDQAGTLSKAERQALEKRRTLAMSAVVNCK